MSLCMVQKLSPVVAQSTHPKLLQLSGIGHEQELKTLGITPVRYIYPVSEKTCRIISELYVQYTCKQPVSMYPALKWYNQPKIGFDWLFFRKGDAATNHFQAGGL
ncbi:hypothetical protein P4S72_00160 [Vibrio sp. PP-XX7]